jgi:hypothetical protein
MTARMKKLGDIFCRAVLREEYASVARLANEYSLAVAAVAAAEPQFNEQTRATISRTIALFTWAQRTLRASREHLRSDLAKTAAKHAYGVASPKKSLPSIQVSG